MEVNDYYSAYTILSSFLGSNNVYEGVEESLEASRTAFSANDVILYKADVNGDYIHKFNQPIMRGDLSITSSVLNIAKDLVEKKKYYKVNLNKTNIKSCVFIKIFFDKFKYVVGINYDHSDVDINDEFINIYVDAMKRILFNFENNKNIHKSIEIDVMTGLGNRAAYDKRIDLIKPNEYFVYGLFDLFRLKNINDNYSHAFGDEYIKQTADILKRHFPKYFYTIDVSGKKNRVLTGTGIYRIGGDEFALISNSETLDDVLLKMLIIREEVRNIDLNINEKLGINYGIVERKANESFKDIYKKADDYLSRDKYETYKVLGLDRRR